MLIIKAPIAGFRASLHVWGGAVTTEFRPLSSLSVDIILPSIARHRAWGCVMSVLRWCCSPQPRTRNRETPFSNP